MVHENTYAQVHKTDGQTDKTTPTSRKESQTAIQAKTRHDQGGTKAKPSQNHNRTTAQTPMKK